MLAERTVALDQRVARIRAVLDRALADPPETMLDLKRRLAGALAVEPGPEALQAMPALREINDAQGRELGLHALVLHFTVASTSREVWDSETLDAQELSRVLETIPALLMMSSAAEKAFTAAIGSVDRLERHRIEKLHASLRHPEFPLSASIAVGPELARLATAACGNSLPEAAPSLSSAERDAIAAAAAPVSGPAPRPARALVNALALRTLIEASLPAYAALGPAHADDEATADSRHELRVRLESLRAAHGVLAPRLDAARSERLARGAKPDPVLEQARRSLFDAYRELSKALAGEISETDGGVIARILEAETEAAAVDAERETRQELLRNAAAGVGAPAVAAPVLSRGMADLARDRRRRAILLGVAAAMVPIAVSTNILFYPRDGASAKLTPELLSPAMAVREVVPIGQAMYAQVATILWDDLTETERRDKVVELGRLASRRGYGVLLVVDESRRERARWSATGGAEIAEARRPD